MSNWDNDKMISSIMSAECCDERFILSSLDSPLLVVVVVPVQLLHSQEDLPAPFVFRGMDQSLEFKFQILFTQGIIYPHSPRSSLSSRNPKDMLLFRSFSSQPGKQTSLITYDTHHHHPPHLARSWSPALAPARWSAHAWLVSPL